MKLRIHADELGPSGGSTVAAAVGARSADHLIFVDADGARALAAAGTVATLLPSAAFYLKLAALRSRPDADRRGRRGRAGERRESRRRLLAVDAVRDDARLLRDGPDLRRSAGRRDAERRVLARSASHGRQPRARQADGCGRGRRAGNRADSRGRADHSIGDQEGTYHRVPRHSTMLTSKSLRDVICRIRFVRSDAWRRLGVGARVVGRRLAAGDGRQPAEDAQPVGR